MGGVGVRLSVANANLVSLLITGRYTERLIGHKGKSPL